MKMAILGTDASYDSINENKSHKENWCPPLGNQLFQFRPVFDGMLKKFPGAESLRREIVLSNNIEDLFQNEYELSK